MIKRNKIKLIISSALILLPTLFGLFIGKILPDEIAVHFGLDGKADRFASPAFAFTVLPLILLAVHWICMIATAIIDKDTEQNKKVFGIIFWIIPVISLSSFGTISMLALGYEFNVYAFVLVLLAVAFVIIGNYMPKTRRSRTTGIKIRWTLANDENWNATHRFAGKIYVLVGLLCLLAIPFSSVAFPYIAFGLILSCVFPPIIYSYAFYRKQLAEGKVTAEDYKKEYRKMVKNPKLAFAVVTVIIVLTAVLVSVLMFTGSVSVTLGESGICVDASYCEDIVILYEDIESAEYRENGVDGKRLYGYGSATLLLGSFENGEFGTYTRYTYTGDRPCIVLTVKGEKVVIGIKDAQELKEIYGEISARISGEGLK